MKYITEVFNFATKGSFWNELSRESWIKNPLVIFVLAWLAIMAVGIIIAAHYQEEEIVFKHTIKMRISHLDISSAARKHYYHVSMVGDVEATVITVTAEQYARLNIGDVVNVVRIFSTKGKVIYTLSEQENPSVATAGAAAVKRI